MEGQVKIRFIRNFTLEPIEMWLSRELRSSGMSVDCEFGGFASAANEIQEIAREKEEGVVTLTVLALGLEMTASDFGHASWAAEAACQRHLMLVRAAIAGSNAPLVINTVLPPLFSPTGTAVVPGAKSQASLVEELNTELRSLAGMHPGRVVLVDWGGFARELGEQGTYDYRFWHTSGAPFATAFLSRYAGAIAGVVRALTGQVRKCLILDCDNTLWGGVVGEDGLQGIELSADSLPGAYFQEFQRSILDLHARGVAIVLCSKNNESDVFDVLDNHPGCLIRREHLSAWRVGWNDKARSIAEIAVELNIGRDALVFVDDSPQECELVRSTLPEVLVIKTPDRHAEFAGFLERKNLFDSLVVTSEDLVRTSSYRQNRERNELSSALGDIAEYKKLLGTYLRVRLAAEVDTPRVLQLIQRTNQFNLTTRRHDQATVKRMIADPDALLICAELGDKFGDLGVIAVAIVMRMGDEAAIDSMLMSCRALGRDAEVAFACAVFSTISDLWHSTRVSAEYIASGKNAQAAGFWERVGLVRQQQGGASANVTFYSNENLAALARNNMPSHVIYMDQTNER